MIYAIVIVALVVVLLVVILCLAATRPDTFRVQRGTNIKASPETIFALINDLHRWDSWSPWEKLDLAMKKTYRGASRGKGAVYEWEGNGKAGAGRMEIAAESPPSRVTINLDFLKPFKAHNISEFSLEPKGSSTDVTWALHGPNLFVGKVMSLFINMDRMIGKDFEAGLVNLKRVAEEQIS